MIVFTDHAKDKLSKELKKLGITEKTVIEILMNPDEMSYDALRNRFVVVSWSRQVAVIYEKNNNEFTVVTVI